MGETESQKSNVTAQAYTAILWEHINRRLPSSLWWQWETIPLFM